MCVSWSILASLYKALLELLPTKYLWNLADQVFEILLLDSRLWFERIRRRIGCYAAGNLRTTQRTESLPWRSRWLRLRREGTRAEYHLRHPSECLLWDWNEPGKQLGDYKLPYWDAEWVNNNWLYTHYVKMFADHRHWLNFQVLKRFRHLYRFLPWRIVNKSTWKFSVLAKDSGRFRNTTWWSALGISLLLQSIHSLLMR